MNSHYVGWLVAHLKSISKYVLQVCVTSVTSVTSMCYFKVRLVNDHDGGQDDTAVGDDSAKVNLIMFQQGLTGLIDDRKQSG